MERNFYTDNFERLLKEKSDEFRMYPSKRVWHSIYNDLHPGRKWPSVAMSMLLVIALLLIGYLNTNDNSTKKQLAGIPASQQGKGISNTNTTNTNIRQSRLTGTNDLQQVNSDQLANNSNAAEVTINSNPGTVNNIVPGNQGNTSVATDNPENKRPENNNMVAVVDNYIRSNQLLSDIAEMNRQKEQRTAHTVLPNANMNENISEANTVAVQNTVTKTSIPTLNAIEENKKNSATENLTVKNIPAVTAGNGNNNKKTVSTEEKAWMEDYALHNKPGRNKWKDRVAMELYVTPGMSYRNLSNNVTNEAAAQAYNGASTPNSKSVSQKPGLGLEAGFGLSYSFAKNLRLKSGVQLNYTSYGINADQTNHPILTTLMLNDPNTGRPYLDARTSSLSNSSGLQSVTVHNNTFQISIPVGLAVKLAGNNNLEWYAGASIQPSFVFGGATHFISSDYSSYVSDPTLLRRWNMNTGFETYLNYKMRSYTLQVGPQFRYQLFSTYTKKYTVDENLYNMGLKVGLVKSF